MGHRLSLLKVLVYRDLFYTEPSAPTAAPPSPGQAEATAPGSGAAAASAVPPAATNADDQAQPQPPKKRRFIVEIFEVPKGVRLFPLLLRFLVPVSPLFAYERKI